MTLIKMMFCKWRTMMKQWPWLMSRSNPTKSTIWYLPNISTLTQLNPLWTNCSPRWPLLSRLSHLSSRSTISNNNSRIRQQPRLKMQQRLNWAISSKTNSSSLKSSSNSNNNRKGKQARSISIDSTNKRRHQQHKCKALNSRRCSKASFIRWKFQLLIISMKTILKHKTYIQTFPLGRRSQRPTSSVRLWPNRVRLQPFNRRQLLSPQSILPTNSHFQVVNPRPPQSQLLSWITVLMPIRTTSSTSIQLLRTKLLLIWTRKTSLCSLMAE